MAGRPIRPYCYTCNNQFHVQQLAFINGAENDIKRQIAITRREELGHPPLHVNDNSRLCLNCNRLIMDEIALIEADPTCLRLDVLTQTASQSCIICNAMDNLQRLSKEARTKIFVKRNIYVPDNVRSCPIHLDEKGLLMNVLLSDLRSINRPYVIKGPQLSMLLQELIATRNIAANKTEGIYESNLR